jgi:RNase P subunit RPR2
LLLTGNERQELQSGTLSYLLQIARYDRDQVNHKKYVELLQKLRQTDNIAFCDLFTVSKMGKQLFENNTIKQLYCENCN